MYNRVDNADIYCSDIEHKYQMRNRHIFNCRLDVSLIKNILREKYNHKFMFSILDYIFIL